MMLHNLMDLLLAVDVSLVIAGARFLLFVELSLMIGFVSLAGCLCEVLTGAWATCGVLPRMGTSDCVVFGVARTGRSCGVCTGIVLCLRGLGSVIPLIS